MKRFNYRFMISISFVGYIFIFLFMFVMKKDDIFSELENRNLAKMPTLSVKGFFEKEFGEKFENYLADQFPMRDRFIEIKSYSELVSQKKENNGVYIGDDGYFIEKFDSFDEDVLYKNISAINDFSKEYNTSVVIVPTSLEVHKDRVPKYSYSISERDVIEESYMLLGENIKKIELLESLTSRNAEYIYYKTDHHWTTLGAYYAYVEFCNGNNMVPTVKDKFYINEVTNDFYGTLFSKGNFTFAKPDSISIFEFKDKEKLAVEYVYSNRVDDSLYRKEYLSQKDKYGVFMDNNHPLVKIKTGVGNGKSLLVVKDSYANSFVPFLTSHYEEIHVVDLRQFKSSINEYAKSNGISDVLVLYNVRNFVSDRNILRLKS